MLKSYEFHPLAKIFPLIEGDEYNALTEDIRENGLLEPIWLYEGKILDGRNRYRACQDAEVELVSREYKGDAPLTFIVSMNLHRRHLSANQILVIGEEIRPEIKSRTPRGRPEKKSANLQPLPGKVNEQIAKVIGASPRSVASAKQIKDKAPDLWEKVKADKMPIYRAEQQLKRRERVTKQPEMPPDKYRVIYADPPWKYNDSGLPEYGHAETHYDAMTISELCDLPIADMAGDDAVLFLWVTSPMLEDAFKIIKVWGFTYKTSFIWDKVKHNYGHYNSVRHELLLICTRGSCTPDANKLHDSVISIERSGKHSEKPDYFRELIDEMYQTGKRIELFARNKHGEWETWGDEVSE